MSSTGARERAGHARRWRAAALAAALAVSGLLAAACGGGGSHAGSGQSPGENLAVGLDSPAFLAAQKACTYLLPFGGGLTGSGTGGTHQQFLQALRVVTCMRSHDYPNWPRRGAKCRKSNERAGRTTAD